MNMQLWKNLVICGMQFCKLFFFTSIFALHKLAKAWFDKGKKVRWWFPLRFSTSLCLKRLITSKQGSHTDNVKNRSVSYLFMLFNWLIVFIFWGWFRIITLWMACGWIVWKKKKKWNLNHGAVITASYFFFLLQNGPKQTRNNKKSKKRLFLQLKMLLSALAQNECGENTAITIY